MKTTFETALDQHEISDFFKGNGIYFARTPEWGDHLYISNWQEMCSVLKAQTAAQSLLTTIFEEYVKYLNESYEDGLFSNIAAYYIARSMFPFLSNDNYDLIENLNNKSKEYIGLSFRLLRTEYDAKNKDLPKYPFEQETQKIKKMAAPSNSRPYKYKNQIKNPPTDRLQTHANKFPLH